jgi:hypothetical protein
MAAAEIHGGQAICQLPPPLREWLVLERFHLHKSASYQRLERDPGFDTKYLPQHCGAFPLPCFLVPRKNLHVFGSQQQDAYGMRFCSDLTIDGSILFPIHPLELSTYESFLRQAGGCDAARAGIRVWAVPTSSTRTLLAWLDGAPETAVCVKTSISSPIFGDRRVHRSRAARSVALSSLIASELGELPRELSYFPESFSFTARAAPHTGAIVRSIPREISSGAVKVAPLFSLIGGEETGHRPLLLTMLDNTAVPVVQLLDDMLCKPFAKLWVELCLGFGWIVEAHGQDLLLELTPELRPTGKLYYRDFEGMQVDWELRRWLGRPAPHDLPGAERWHDAYGTLGPYRYCSQTWYKRRVSLQQFLQMFLKEVESSLQLWHRHGLVAGPPCGPDELTMAFSRHVFDAIERRFGVRVGAAYNIERFLNRFLLLVGRLRREIISAPPMQRAGLAA